jgi:WD40 repeat protein/DNA-binding winged helix-turn-helix (wHTH) protein
LPNIAFSPYIDLKVTTKTEHDELVETPFRVGDWLVEPRLNRLTRGEESIQIEHKMMDVLVCLAERPGDLVPRQHIIDTVWVIEFISEGTLTRIVAELRRALGDDAREPRFIETIRGKGYRLLVPVEVEQRDSAKIAQFPARAAEDDRNPYPGLAAFTEADAEFFFGREAEVNDLWRKITSRRLLAVIGPSGVGKTSFLRAGLLPATPEGWGTLICQPGEAPFAALARALVPEISDDPEVVSKLVDFETNAPHLFTRWRERHHRALLIVDQFEEIFTLNPPDVQARFAELLGTIARNADIHVLLSMRDDFLYRCQAHSELRPVLDGLTALQQPEAEALRRALVKPAQRLGFRFESDQLPAEMIGEVGGERGGLPMLAFAVAWLWEKRDRRHRVITRQAYDDIGGVGGALARHAEATIDRIGSGRIPIVRELFRNLITAEGTRAVREWDELLSVFSDSQRESSEEVVRALIDARLLTSYELRDESEEPTRRVEVIHESLLANWPRLVRWRTKDQEGAQLREELRQAARTWNEHGRTDDFLWTGKAYREFSVWREDYSGGLTENEEAFAEDMTRHAQRRKRRRRLAATAAFALLLVVLAIVGGFWRRSAVDSRRAEAANLFSLAQLHLEEYPTGAIAYAIASLELADKPEVRRFALGALWRGPTEFRLSTPSPYSLDFGPDGRWLATADPGGGGKLWPSDGGPPMALEGSDVAMDIRTSPRGDLVAANMNTERRELGLWSFPEGRFLRSFDLGDQGFTQVFVFSPDGKHVMTSTEPLAAKPRDLVFRSWPVEGGQPVLVARLPLHPSSDFVFADVDPTWSRLSWPDGRRVRIARLEGATLHLASATSVGHERAIGGQVFDKQGRQLATADKGGTIRVWSLTGGAPELTHTLGGKGGLYAASLMFDPSGSMLAAGGGSLWDLTAPPHTEPLRVGDSFGLAFAPAGDWLATGGGSVSLWPLARTYPRVLRGHEEGIAGLAFAPDGTRLVSTSEDGSVRVWSLRRGVGDRSRILFQYEEALSYPCRLAIAPDGSFFVVGNLMGKVTFLPLDGGPARDLTGFTDVIRSLAVGPGGRLVAAGAGKFIREEAVVRVWNLESGEVRVLDAGDGESILDLKFTRDGGLWVASRTRLRRWQLAVDPPSVVTDVDLSVPDGTKVFCDDLSRDDRLLLLGADDGRLWTQDLYTGETRELISHAGRAVWASFGASGEIVVSADALGGVRVGPVNGEAPHLLLGHKGEVRAVAVSPDGRWIASGGADSTIRLWPMPDLSKPPLHTLPRAELIAKLKTLTNLRAVRDSKSSTGWKIEVGPFPGWETAPTW